MTTPRKTKYKPTYPILAITPKTTNQEIFDACMEHLYQQGRPALREGDCVYRSPEGLACAVGCFLSDAVIADRHLDAHNDSILIDVAWERLEVEPADPLVVGADERRENLLWSLQGTHDQCEVTSLGAFKEGELRKALAEVAHDHDLALTWPGSRKTTST